MDNDLKPGERHLQADQADSTATPVAGANLGLEADTADMGTVAAERTLLAAEQDSAERTLHAAEQGAAERTLHAAEQAGTERTLQATEQASGLLAGQTDRLVLYEERAKVDVVRESLGAVTVRKVVTEREELVPVTLRSECLEIVVQPGAGCVRMGDQELQPGQTYQVELTNERASVHKEIVPISEVSFEKRAVSQDVQQTVTLRREVLDIEDPQHLVANRSELEGDLR